MYCIIALIHHEGRQGIKHCWSSRRILQMSWSTIRRTVL